MVVGSAGTALGAGFTLTLKAGFFFPGDKIFREIYTAGRPSASMSLSRLAVASRSGRGSFFGKTGLLSVSEERPRSASSLLRGTAGRIRHSGHPALPRRRGGLLPPHEENPLGTVDEAVWASSPRPESRSGSADRLWLDVFAGLSGLHRAGRRRRPLEAKIGGLSAGIGLAYRF